MTRAHRATPLRAALILSLAYGASGCFRSELLGADAMSGASGMGAGSGAGMSGEAGMAGDDAMAGTGGMAGMSGVGQASGGIGGQLPPAGQGGTGPSVDRVFDAGTDPNRNNVQAGALCERLAQIQCAGEQYCCEDPGRDRAACEQKMRDACINEAYFDAISNDPVTAFDATTAAGTFTEIERMASVCDSRIVAFSISRDGFMAMFHGTAQAGASCFPLGTDPKVVAAKLASCTDLTSYACLPESALSWSCAERGATGAPCFTDVNCLDGLYCPNENLEIGKATCEPRKEVGAPCTWGNECESLFCEAGACVPESQRNAYCLRLSE